MVDLHAQNKFSPLFVVSSERQAGHAFTGLYSYLILPIDGRKFIFRQGTSIIKFGITSLFLRENVLKNWNFRTEVSVGEAVSTEY